MNKGILIIAYPGIFGAENYCEGVLRDINNYKDFFMSPAGGGWKDEEIHILDTPTIDQVINAVDYHNLLDYSMIIFSGHGYYDPIEKHTVMEINNDEHLSETALSKVGIKRTIILDCCRVPYSPILESIQELVIKREASLGFINLQEIREQYENRIMECPKGIVRIYSCDVGETAGDDQREGGVYSWNLLREAKRWSVSNRPLHRLLMEKHIFKFLSIVEVHTMVCKNINEQTPRIIKPRTSPYYPFAVRTGD